MSLGHGACAFFFFNDTATTEIYTLSLHDALPISGDRPAEPALAVSDKAVHRDAHRVDQHGFKRAAPQRRAMHSASSPMHGRSEEHTSELQSRQYLVCRLLLEKKQHLTHCTRLALT